jgi:hypothetical protein
VAASESVGDGQWAMEVIERRLERAFRQPPKFSTLDRYLTHQHILLETDVDEAGNAPETVKEDCFPGNPDPPHCFSLEGTVVHIKTEVAFSLLHGHSRFWVERATHNIYNHCFWVPMWGRFRQLRRGLQRAGAAGIPRWRRSASSTS